MLSIYLVQAGDIRELIQIPGKGGRFINCTKIAVESHQQTQKNRSYEKVTGKSLLRAFRMPWQKGQEHVILGLEAV